MGRRVSDCPSRRLHRRRELVARSRPLFRTSPLCLAALEFRVDASRRGRVHLDFARHRQPGTCPAHADALESRRVLLECRRPGSRECTNGQSRLRTHLPALPCISRRNFSALPKSLLCVALLVPCLGLAQVSDHTEHESVGWVPQEILSRPVPLRNGIGPYQETVTTSSAEAQRFYNQGTAYLHSYVWIEAARSFHQALRADPKMSMAYLGLSYAYSPMDYAAARRSRASAIAFGRLERPGAEQNPHSRAAVGRHGGRHQPGQAYGVPAGDRRRFGRPSGRRGTAVATRPSRRAYAIWRRARVCSVRDSLLPESTGDISEQFRGAPFSGPLL